MWYFRCDVAIGPEAEHQPWRGSQEEQAHDRQPLQGTSHLLNLVSTESNHTALFFMDNLASHTAIFMKHSIRQTA